MSNSNPYASPQPTSPPQFEAKPRFAPCPGCGNTTAQPIGFTWWGGALGPRMFNHVKCSSCGRAYNGKTGKWNTQAIVIYVAVTTVIGLVLGIGLALSGAFG